jgi:hypothetical protein
MNQQSDPEILREIARLLRCYGDNREAHELERIALRHHRITRALDELAEDARQDARAAEAARNVVPFSKKQRRPWLGRDPQPPAA